MAQKKFGTFGGVFTPSILTILGVIMYLRLPMIVGETGLFMAIGIVAVAHLISVTTGLSVSSIATDKKVRAGGTYYMVSRSLGLPIGGTLGLALFVGLSFSVSLYLIGFAESFLSYWGMEVSKDAIRITGSIILFVVTIITFISTSVALKTQYFIMAVIILSLVSIFLGSHEFTPSVPLFSNMSSTVPIMVLFGIFFPAVTGFEAGVSMSGDLKDPKKSIPSGTILAIVIGFVAYIILVFFFTYTVSGEVLATDPNVLLKISLVPELVVAGIWGATLSSAFGSILGAPRILQATAVDRITPKVFAKGYGDSNEPRNALILSFLIAESGILIGELDIIARIVSIFFITTYGFLNLSCAFESLTSADFRPSFKTPAWISLFGAVACMIVMIQLDFVSMIAATLILGALYIYLKRKELTLQSGDVWGSLWASLVKSGLQKLKNNDMHSRNWRPNIIMFSGNKSSRPYMFELGKDITGKFGLITAFNIQSPNKKSQEISTDQSESDSLEDIDLNVHLSDDKYDGMEGIIKNYGFTGVKPNTVLMGWSKIESEINLFIDHLLKIQENQFNSIILNFNPDRKFGKYKSIDVWWSGKSANLLFTLSIIRHIINSSKWKDSNIRLLVVNNDIKLTEKIDNTLRNIVDNYRINLEIKIINNSIERIDKNELITNESSNTDLTIVSLPDFKLLDSKEEYLAMSMLLDGLGTTLLINASSYFEDTSIDLSFHSVPKNKPSSTITINTDAVETDLPDIILPENNVLANTVLDFNNTLENTVDKLFENYIINIFEKQKKLIDDISSLTTKEYNRILKSSNEISNHKILKSIKIARTEFLFQMNKLFSQYLTISLPNQKESFVESCRFLIAEIDKIKKNTPEQLSIFVEKSKFKANSGDSPHLKRYKFRKRLLKMFSKKDIEIKINMKIISDYFLLDMKKNIFIEFSKHFGINSYKEIFEFQHLIRTIHQGFLKIENSINNKNLKSENIISEIDIINNHIDELSSKLLSDFKNYSYLFHKAIRENILELSSVFNRLDANKLIIQKYKTSKSSIKYDSIISDLPQLWLRNITVISNIANIEFVILNFSNRLTIVFNNVINDLRQVIDDAFTKYIETYNEVDEAEQNDNGQRKKINQKQSMNIIGDFSYSSLISSSLKEIGTVISSIPESIDVLSNDSLKSIESSQFNEVEVLSISLQKLVKYYTDTEIIGPLNDYLIDIDSTLQQIKNKLMNQYKLISYHNLQIEKTIDTDIDDYESQYQLLLQNSKKIVLEERLKILDIKKQIQNFIDIRIKNLTEKLNPNMIIRSSGELQQYMMKQEMQKAISKIEMFEKLFLEKIKFYFVNLWFRKSEAVIFARRLQESEKYVTIVNHLQSFAEVLTPNSIVLEKLPFYYNQLFAGKQIITKDYWIGRSKELIHAEKAYYKFLSGKSGGLLIIGASDSGKSSFSTYVGSKLSKNNHFYNIYPPEGGSIEIDDMLKQFSDALNSKGELDEILMSVPNNSVFILHDLELWWERSANGFAVIDFILKTISEFGNRFFFVINMNTNSFNFINKIKLIENDFLTIIRMRPFNASELRDLILNRHKSSSMQFRYGKKMEEKMTEFQYAKLFNKYFEHTKGNPGAAIHSWITNIKEINKNGEIVIDVPQKPDYDIFDKLKPIWIVILIQFILHKRLSYKKLERIFDNNDFEEIEKSISELLNADILLKNQNNIIYINQYLQPYIENKLISMGMM